MLNPFIATQLKSTSSWVELCRYKRGFRNIQTQAYLRHVANIIINVKNAVYRHVNGKIAQLKQQISELGPYIVVHIVNVNVQHN